MSEVQLVASHGRESDGGAKLDGSKFRQDVLELLSQEQEVHKLPQGWIKDRPDERLEVMMNLLENKDIIPRPSERFWKLLQLTVKLSRHTTTEQVHGGVYVVTDSTKYKSVGKGGFGTVYRTTMRGRDVVVKHLIITSSSEDARKMLWNACREALMLRFLEHKNILEFIGVTEHSQLGVGIVFTWVDGGSIVDYANKHPETTLEQRCQWLHDISRGVDYLHSIAHIAHGDLKPSNILMTSDGIVKIADFGLAVFPDGVSFGSQRGGNIHWTAPEHLWLQSPDGKYLRPTYSGDIYSLAITCIEVLTGKRAWPPLYRGRLGYSRAMRIIYGDRPQIPEDPSQIPKELASALPLWWHSDPDRRPKSWEIVAFFDAPTTQPPGPTIQFPNLNSPSRRYTPSEGLISTLCVAFENEAAFLRTWAKQNFRQQAGYPDCPVHILCEEMPFLKGLRGCCENDLELAETFCYPALEVILQRGRQITSRSVFLSNANQPSQTTHPLSVLGYDCIEPTNGDSGERAKQCIEHIKKLISGPTTRPGILVILSGRSGWLNDQIFIDYLFEDVQERAKWTIELVAWGKDSFKLTGPRVQKSLTRINKFYDDLFPEAPTED